MHLSLVVLLLAADPAVELDKDAIVLRGGTLHDGSGKPGVKGDVAISRGRIVALGTFTIKGKPRIIDVKGLIVSPGFIDLHTHSDYPLQKNETRANRCYLHQGATTVITGNCGFGPENVADYFKKLEKGTIGTNVIHLIPHNSVRRAVMKNANRPPTKAELKSMQDLIDKGMKAGAWGMSTGLIYNPGTYARTDELIALARAASKHGGIYASHIRTEGTEVLTAIEEALKIGKEAKLPVHISHLKATGPKAWGKSADIIATIEKARKAGQVVTADQYPYAASSTSLAAMVISAKYREGEADDYKKRLDDRKMAPLIRKDIVATLKRRGGGKTLRIAFYKPKPAWKGKNLEQIAKAEKKDVVDIVLKIERNGGAAVISFGMSEEDVRLIMKQPWVATASDGSSQTPSKETMPHPRSYGTFPRKIGRYGIADGAIKLEHALRVSSGLPADILRLKDRGYLKKGYHADIVVFDSKTFRDTATYDDPHQYATGVKYLLVNGVLAIDEGKVTGKMAGKVLRHQK